MEETKARLTWSPKLGIECPSEFEIMVGHDVLSQQTITVKKTQCTDCKGTGTIKLFISDATCDKCLGAGHYAEG